MEIIFVIILPIISSALQVRYDGYKVFRTVPRNFEQLQSLRNLQLQNDSYSFWNQINLNRSVDVMIPPNHGVEFKRTLDSLHLGNTLIIEDVQKIINNKDVSPNNTDKEAFDWTKYHTLSQIYRWLRSLVIKYPGIVTLAQGGRSHQGRNITGVKISHRAGNKAVFIEGGIHACEWISPATATYIIDQLLNSYDPNVRDIAESRDWYIFPVINPDGYVYTTTDRLWRKNRRWITLSCIGVDLNRNWNYKWMHGGASQDPCQNTYAGPRPFSEIETKSLSEFINGISPTLEGYITLHSYGQQLLIPFGHDGREVPANNDQLLRIGETAGKALAQRHGTKYTVGNILDVAAIGSGASDDWASGTYRHLKFVYTYELRDTGRYGFLLPPKQIIPTGEETLDSIVSIILQFQNEEDRT